VTAAEVISFRDGKRTVRQDKLATEEPMEIRAEGPDRKSLSIAVTMRTPGNDFELAAGFMFTEGLIADASEIFQIKYCALSAEEDQEYNIVTVWLKKALDESFLQRNFFANSSCGICGKATLDQVETRCKRVAFGASFTETQILGMPARVGHSQRVFQKTGGLHAAALFNDDGLGALREDVGRHNAVDKIIGQSFLAKDVPLSESALFISGRASFEIVQKAGMAGIPIICAVSAPSSLAAQTADRLGITLLGFLRPQGFNIYTHPTRIKGSP